MHPPSQHAGERSKMEEEASRVLVWWSYIVCGSFLFEMGAVATHTVHVVPAYKPCVDPAPSPRRKYYGGEKHQGDHNLASVLTVFNINC